jgi:DNA-binding winged helix-turn-helix (wHTH) protein/Tol biopolymer transport system component
MNQRTMPQTARFGVFEVDLQSHELRKRGIKVKLHEQPFQVLATLLEHPGEVVSREELRRRIWPSDTFVDFDKGLNGAVNRLRDALGDSADSPRFVETVPRQGYRFIAALEDAAPVVGPGVLPKNGAGQAEAALPGKPGNDLPRVARARVLQPRVWVLISLAVAGLVLLASNLASRRNGAPGIAEQRITSNSPEAAVESAIVSPDGKYIAYRDPSGLYLRVIATGETRRWDLPKDFIAKPDSWFPDGTNLLVTRWEGTPPMPSLWKLSLLGGQPRKLVDKSPLGSVSPDGMRIAYVTLLAGELWVMDPGGSNPHKIAEASQRADPRYPSEIVRMAWSPNSRRIAFIERYALCTHYDQTEPRPFDLTPVASLSTLGTRDAEGGDLQVILKNIWLGPALAWAPDGRILFASRANPESERDNEELHSIRVDERTGRVTGQPQRVTAGAGTIGEISVTSDGKRLVLWRTNAHEQAFISEFDAYTRKWKTPRRLTLEANSNQATAWLADSKTVLFVSNRNGTWTLFKQAIDDTTADVLVEGHSLYLPRLSADGSQVIYGSLADSANAAAPRSIMRLPVAGGPPQLVVQDVGIGNFQCARLPSRLCIVDKPQGNDLIFVSFDPERGIGHELTRSSGGRHNWALSPDGRTLVDYPDNHSIRFYSVKNGVAKEDKTIRVNNWFFGNGDWTADGKGLLVPATSPAGTPVMLEVNRAGKASVVLEGTPGTGFEFMIQAPDGHYGILGAVVPGDDNAWMVDNF